MKIIFSVLLSTIIFISIVEAEEMEPMDVYNHMVKTLDGEWKLSPEKEQVNTQKAYTNKYVFPLVGTDTTAIAYTMVGFGSSLEEDLLPDTKKEMITMYHCDDYVDCTQLLATHYCTKMNQPEFILNVKNTTKEKIIFDCNMKTKLCNSNEDHVHTIIIEVSEEEKHLKMSYLGWTDQNLNKKNSIYHFDKK